MNRAEIELDTLADTDRTGAQNQNLFLLFRITEGTGGFIFRTEYAVVVRSFRLKLGSAGINHLEGSLYIPFVTHLSYL